MKKKQNAIYGRQPVLEALEQGVDLDKIFLKKNSQSDVITKIVQLAKEKKVPMQQVPIEKLNRLTRQNHQGIFAFKAMIQYYELEDVLSQAYEKGEIPLFLVLDGITDVRNFGAIIRSAACMGVHGIVVPFKGSAQINEETVKASAGAIWQMHICRAFKISEALDYLKSNGVQIIASSLEAEKPLQGLSLKGPTCIIMGAEGEGIHPFLMDMSDEKFIIPMKGDFDSLNVSVAAGMILYEVQRQRME